MVTEGLLLEGSCGGLAYCTTEVDEIEVSLSLKLSIIDLEEVARDREVLEDVDGEMMLDDEAWVEVDVEEVLILAFAAVIICLFRFLLASMTS